MEQQRAAIGAALNQILDICRGSPEGLSGKALQAGLANVPIEIQKEAINLLLQKGQLLALQKDGELFYKEQSREEATRFKGLQKEDMIVYQAIQATRNEGIWARDLKKETKLQQPQINKAIKNLESRKIIKQVPTMNKSRKVYMLAELKPSEKVTGGAWYSGAEFDSELLNVLKQQCLQFLLKQTVANVDQVANFVRKSGMGKDDMHTKHFKQVMDLLVLDGDAEEVVSTGTGIFSSISVGSQCYRASQSRISESSAFTNIPCGVCPVIHLCSENGIISPKTCTYYQEWLNF